MTRETDAVFSMLRQSVHGDPALQARLFALPDVPVFIAAVRQLAQASDLALTDDDVLQAMRAGRRAWSDRKLP
ncbi:MAG: hypothetical protein WAW34_01400 [Rhodoferax sp.]